MPLTSKLTLKSYFETGDVPTQANFVDLIDSCYNESGGFQWFRFIPETINSSGLLYDGNQTKFVTNGANIWFKTMVPIPDGVRKIKSVRLIGNSLGGRIDQLKLLYYSDFQDTNLTPVADYPGYRYTLYDQPVAGIPTYIFPADFDTQVFMNVELNFTTYRYFSIHLNIKTNAAIPFLYIPAGYILLKPVGLEYE
jgi:hypothetical protein